MGIPAVIFAPQHITADLTRCAAYCTARGYEVVGIVRDWESAAKLVRDGIASVIVAARFEHLPADREPRTEVVAAGNGVDTANLSAHGRQRRPRPA